MQRARSVPLNLEAALAKAREDFRSGDPAAMAGRAYAEFEPEPGGKAKILVPYFGEWYAVDFPEANVTVAPQVELAVEDPAAVPPITQVILLHYLTSASGVELSGRWVAYHDLPQGTTYERAFHQRAIAPLEAAFGFDLNGFVGAGVAAGGERARLGDASFYFRVLPRMPLMCVLWLGDEDVPPGANVLFDAAAGAFLPGEDIAYVGIALTARMLGAKRGALLT